MSNPRILIIEDDPNWQKLLQEIVIDIAGQPVVVSCYQAAIDALSSGSYSLAIVDVSLSMAYHNREGLDVLRQIADSLINLPAIVVTGFPTMELAIEALADLKAIHFFTKADFDRRKFIQVINKELGQGKLKVPAIFERRINRAVVKDLSERELEVLYRLSQGQTNKQIADELIISVNTVKKHVQNIFTKLNVNNRAAAVSQAFDVG